MKRVLCFIGGFIIFIAPVSLNAQFAYRYAIIVNDTTFTDPNWAEVVDSLIARHSAQVFTWNTNIWETQIAVAAYKSDYIGFVCQVIEASPYFVLNYFWPYIRQLDSDPYPDAVSGIITGCDAQHRELASGVYFCRLTSESTVQTKKLILLK